VETETLHGLKETELSSQVNRTQHSFSISSTWEERRNPGKEKWESMGASLGTSHFIHGFGQMITLKCDSKISPVFTGVCFL
jgi:hypothetical protein